MTSRREECLEDLRFRVLRLIADQPDISQRELAERLGVSNGKLHYCVKALVERGMVKLENFANSRHHLGYFYFLTPKGVALKAAMAGHFLVRKTAEYEALKREIALLRNELGQRKPCSAQTN